MASQLGGSRAANDSTSLFCHIEFLDDLQVLPAEAHRHNEPIAHMFSNPYVVRGSFRVQVHVFGKQQRVDLRETRGTALESKPHFESRLEEGTLVDPIDPSKGCTD